MERLCCPGHDITSLSLTVLIWEMGMNIMSVPGVVGRGERDAVREGMLVALARVLSPPQPEL